MFDLELQAPAASTKLPAGQPAFRAVLGVFGHASAGGSLLTSGLDIMYCLHQVPKNVLPSEICAAIPQLLRHQSIVLL